MFDFVLLRFCKSLHARLNSHYKIWSYKTRKHKRLEHTEICLERTYSYKMSVNSRLKATEIIGQMKAFFRQRIPESSCARKEIVDIDIVVTSRNGERKIMQSIRITSRPPSRVRNCNQLSQIRWTPTKVIPIEKTWAGYILTMCQWFKRACQWKTIVLHICFCSLSNNSK